MLTHNSSDQITERVKSKAISNGFLNHKIFTMVAKTANLKIVCRYFLKKSIVYL